MTLLWQNATTAYDRQRCNPLHFSWFCFATHAYILCRFCLQLGVLHTYTSCSCIGSVKVTNILWAFRYQHASKHDLATWCFTVFGLLVVFQQHKHPSKYPDQSHMKPRVFRSKENNMPLAGTPRCLGHTLAVCSSYQSRCSIKPEDWKRWPEIGQWKLKTTWKDHLSIPEKIYGIYTILLVYIMYIWIARTRESRVRICPFSSQPTAAVSGLPSSFWERKAPKPGSSGFNHENRRTCLRMLKKHLKGGIQKYKHKSRWVRYMQRRIDKWRKINQKEEKAGWLNHWLIRWKIDR